MKLRPYQILAMDGVFESWKTNPSVLVSMATGLGKTVVFGEVVRRVLAQTGKRVMVLAHREELIRQGCEKIAAATGADEPGRRGAAALGKLLGLRHRIVLPPAPHKDLRDWCAADKIDLAAFRRHAHAFPWTR